MERQGEDKKEWEKKEREGEEEEYIWLQERDGKDGQRKRREWWNRER